MNIAPSRDLRIGQIVEGLLDVIERNAVPALVYVAMLALVNGALAYFGIGYTAVMQQLAKGFIGFVVGMVAAFLLIVTMLRRERLLTRDPDDSMLAFVALSVLTSLGVLVGFVLIVFPGFYLMARWSIAQPMLVAQGLGPVEAMKASWERTSGSEFAILVIVVVLVVVQAGTGFLVGSRLGQDNLLGIGVIQVISSVTSVVGIALSVALYRLMVAGQNAQTVKTFE